jgi:hypothetical protein
MRQGAAAWAVRQEVLNSPNGGRWGDNPATPLDLIFCSVWSDRKNGFPIYYEKNIRITALHGFLDDWGVPPAVFQLALALRVFAAVEYALGDRVLTWGEVSFFIGLAGGFCYGWRARKKTREYAVSRLPLSSRASRSRRSLAIVSFNAARMILRRYPKKLRRQIVRCKAYGHQIEADPTQVAQQ